MLIYRWYGKPAFHFKGSCMKVFKAFLFFLVLLAGTFARADQDSSFFSNIDKAKAYALAHDRQILMVFAGSDWCRPCIQFKRFILESEPFKAFASKELVILYLDFPSSKKNQLPEDQKKHNEKLAEKYNPHGTFPLIILMNSEEDILGHLKFSNQPPESFIAECKSLIPEKKGNSEQLFPAKKVVKLMGCRFEISAVASDKAIAWKAVENGISEISRIEKIISSWDENSQTSLINKNAGVQAVHVDKELFELVKRAKKISVLTNGAFDISFASMDKIWSFDGTEHPLPDSSLVAEACSKINWENIILDSDSQTVFLKDKGMKIGFGAIGKGFAANSAKKLMSEMTGVYGGAVNASGDLIVWGKQVDTDQWTIQIADPKNKERSLGALVLQDMAIVTSGDYEKYFMNNETRYAHIINPKTGYPTTGIKSVSIICPDTEVADALATSVFVLGKDAGLTLINELNNIECMIITADDELFTSDQLKINYY